MALLLGAGGVLAELMSDTVTLLLPVTRTDIEQALRRLRVWRLVEGYRGRCGDGAAVVRAIEAVIAFADAHRDRLEELDLNPLRVLPGRAVAVDALIRLSGDGVDQAVAKRDLRLPAGGRHERRATRRDEDRLSGRPSDHRAGRDWWSLQPLADPPVPTSDEGRDAIDDIGFEGSRAGDGGDCDGAHCFDELDVERDAGRCCGRVDADTGR